MQSMHLGVGSKPGRASALTEANLDCAQSRKELVHDVWAAMTQDATAVSLAGVPGKMAIKGIQEGHCPVEVMRVFRMLTP
jgi:hypothetical protein